MIYIINNFNNYLNDIIPSIEENLQDIKRNAYNYSAFLNSQNKLTELEYRVKEVLIVIDELGKSDEDMSKMYLSEKREEDNHEEMEILIENYQKYIQIVLNDLQKYSREIDSSQNIISIHLAEKRNDIAMKNLYISLTSLSMSIGTITSGIFGMNLRNDQEDSSYAFIIVIIFIIFTMMVIQLFLTKYYLKIRKNMDLVRSEKDN